MSEVLNSFIDKFVVKDRRERYRSLLSSQKRRKDGVWDLLHDGRHLDKRKFHNIEISDMDNVSAALERLGVASPVYVLSSDEDYDGKRVSIREILEIYLGRQVDVLAYDDTSGAGYYENHEGEIYVFSSGA